MEHPYGRCRECGERVYATIDGGYRCPNCETRYPDDPERETSREPGRR